MRRLLALAVVFAACKPPPPQPPAPPELSFSDMTLYQYDRGSVAFRASAKTAFGDRHHLDLTQIEVHHRGARQVGALDIAAPKGSIDVDNNGFVLSGGVSVIDGTGRHLQTESGSFDPVHKVFEVPGVVNVRGQDLAFTAAGVSAEQESEELTFHGPIAGTFRMKQSQVSSTGGR